MRVRKSAEAIVAAVVGRMAEQGRTRVGERDSMKPMKTEVHRSGGVQTEEPGRYPEGAGLRVEVESVGVERTKAERSGKSGLMDVECVRGNLWLGQRCQALWAELQHPEYKGFTLAEMLEQERTALMPCPPPFDGYVEKMSRVSSTGLVSVDRNRYSVPCEWVGQWVSCRLYPGQIAVVAAEAVVATHARLSDRDHVQYDWQHYIPLIERKPGALRNGAPFAAMPGPLARLRQILLRRPGGDRIMAQVLAAIPAAGLDAVLVAIELVLESCLVIFNVIARLQAEPQPASVEPSLTLTEAPLANTGRYDSLLSAAACEVIPLEAEVTHE